MKAFNNKKINMQKILLFLLTGIILASCKDKDSLIGLGMQSGQFEMKFDTLDYKEINITTKRADLISLSGATIGLLGDYLDPYFGRTQAILAFQLALKSSTLNLGENPTGDEVILKLTKRSGYYGLDSAANHEVKVWRVAKGQNLDNLDSTEVSMDKLLPYKGELLGHKTMNFNPNDTVPWEIPLNPELARSLIDSLNKNKNLYASDSSFKVFFPGLIVETVCTCSKGNIVSIDYSADLLYMRIYYRNSEDNNRELDFILKEGVKRYSIFKHDYESTEVEKALNNDADYKTMAFIQGMNGVGSKIEINGLDKLFNDTIHSINSAILRCHLAKESDTANYIAPTSVFIKVMDEKGNEEFTVDYVGQTANTTRGINYNPEINGYDIVLNRLLFEKIKEKKKSMVITLYANSQLTRANRAIIAGSEYTADTTLRPKLYIIRSK
jgi:predicted transcriptional regulator